jgi:hypothetical protein
MPSEIPVEKRAFRRPRHIWILKKYGCVGVEWTRLIEVWLIFNLHSRGWNQGPLDTAAT